MKTTEWVLLDTETSGLAQPIYCVEIAAQRMKGLNPDGPPFRALLNHDVEIEPTALSLHGYSRSFLRANGRDPATVHREFNGYAGARPVVAFNLSFDWARVLAPELKRLGIDPQYAPGFCALTLTRRCVDETASHRLDALRSHFFPGSPPASHHALDDVEVTQRLILEILWPRLERAGIQSFSAVVDFSRRTPVRDCLDKIHNPEPEASSVPTQSAQDLESELVTLMAGMLADDRIVDAEVWTLKHWLDSHADHQSDLATRSRIMIATAFEDGQLSAWELDEIKRQLQKLIGSESAASTTNLPAPAEERDSGGEKKRRLSLTKRQLEEECGMQMLNLLSRITADGVLSDDEIKELADWLLQHQGHDLPAIAYLIDVVHGILADGRISDSERVDLFFAIEKVLPPTERRTAREARVHADATSTESLPKIGRDDLKKMTTTDKLPKGPSDAGWRADPMTEAQRAFIKSMNGSIRNGATKGEASDMIESLLGNKPITSRQQMVMRFWGRNRQQGEGPREISEWMDEFYREDADRKLAWELFKNESEDNGLQGDPNRVPLGIGPSYLARIKAGGDAAIPKFVPPLPMPAPRASERPAVQKKSGPRYGLIVVVGALASVVVLAFAFRREPTRPAAPATNVPTTQSNIGTKADNSSTEGNIKPNTGKAGGKSATVGSPSAPTEASGSVPAADGASPGRSEDRPMQIGGPSETSPANAARNFKAIAKGMKPDQVLALVGQPNIKTSSTWMYSGQGTVRFADGMVSSVNLAER